MSGERLPPGTAPLDHHLFDDVCGLSENVTHSSTPPSTSEFAEWTPSDLWFPTYQNLLQGAPGTAAGEAQADTAGPDRSNSSNASAAEGSAGPSRGSQGFFSRTKEKVKRWKNRTFAQQEANKAAQKRYRERRKSEVTQLQAQADALAAQVQALEGLGQENSRLAASNEAIVKHLSGSASLSGSGRQNGTSSGSGQNSDWQSFNDKFLGQVEELRQYLERCDVVPSPSDAGTPPEVLQEIVRRTGEAMASCMQALNLGGLKLQHLMDAIETRQAYASPDGGGGYHPSMTAAGKLNMSAEQISKGLLYRQHVLDLLDRIYMERERLNGAVKACLTDGQPGLPDQLRALKANLAAEQRAVSEQHYLVFRMLLSHTQGAWLLCYSYPYHCCCIAFLKGLGND